MGYISVSMGSLINVLGGLWLMPRSRNPVSHQSRKLTSFGYVGSNPARGAFTKLYKQWKLRLSERWGCLIERDGNHTTTILVGCCGY